MNKTNEQSKEELLADIDKLISYGKEESTINPDLLAYLEISDLVGIRKNLLARVGKLSEEDKDWLEQFKKYE
ncbi:MAG TPA: hypothetical protein EYG98_05045 [Sulfurovum sp.]|nr:hypothetical protein [Sulfurovum sp.]